MRGQADPLLVGNTLVSVYSELQVRVPGFQGCLTH